MDRLEKLHATKLSNSKVPSAGFDPPEESVATGSQIGLVVFIGLFVFLSEMMVMVILYFMPALPAWFKILFDSSLLVLLLSPVLYFAVLRPMVQQNLERRRAEEKLKHHGEQLEDLVNQRTSELSTANDMLKQQIRVRTTAENLMRERTVEMDDYIRELQCLYAISRLMEKPNISMEELVTKTIGLIPFAWLSPETIGVRVTLADRQFETENFKETQWQQNSSIRVADQRIGLLKVVYLEELAATDSEPFPKGERGLIQAISERLGGILERIETAEKLKQELTVNATLSDLSKSLIAPSASIEDIAKTVLNKARSLTKSRHGYITSIDPLKSGAVALNLTEMLEDQCVVTSEKKIVFPQAKNGNYQGLWGHSLNSRESFFTNSPQKHPAAGGTPAGHIALQNFLSVPIIMGQKLVGQIALANKDDNYTQQDLTAISQVAEFYVLAIQRNRVEEELQKAKIYLEKRVEDRTAQIAIANQKLTGEIEERKHAEAQLHQSKTMLQAAFDGISDPLILVSRNMEIRMINETALQYYEIADWREAVGKTCYCGAGRPAPCEGCTIPAAVLQGEGLTFERQGFINPERLEKVVIYPLKEKGYGAGDAVVHITDITEAKRLEQQLIQSEKMASLGVLVSSIAHEINNPNNFVSFNIPILRDYFREILPIIDDYSAVHPQFELCNMAYPEFRQDIFKLLDNIEHGSGRINSFVSNLREYSQIKERSPRNWVDMNTIIEKVLSICQSKIKKSVRSFVKTIPESLPKIYSNAHVLEQILINLLVNAANAADKRDSWIKLNVNVNKNWADHIIIEISDNGCGMDEETRRKIFDPFFTTKSTADGTGLGLYICHNLIQSLAGRIEVESESEKGSRFMVVLPGQDRRKKAR